MRLLINIAGVLAVSVIGATLTVVFDQGGTGWLKFLLYLTFVASISSTGFLSSHSSCSDLLLHLRKRS